MMAMGADGVAGRTGSRPGEAAFKLPVKCLDPAVGIHDSACRALPAQATAARETAILRSADVPTGT